MNSDLKDPITLVVASDDHYAILVAALIKSIEVNHLTGEKIELYIISDRISKTNKHKIAQSTSPQMTTVHWCEAKDVLPEGILIPLDTSGFPATAFYRFFSPYIIPEDRSRVLYLDVDMIMVDDISKLWYQDIGDYLLGAVQDLGEVVSCPWGGIPNYEALNIPADTKYFNSGLLLIDAQRWRRENVTAQIVKAMNDNRPFIRFMDQYGGNVVLYDKWFPLSREWNWFTALGTNGHYRNIHFLDIKPIFKSYNGAKEFKDEFFKYLELTPWKGFRPVGDYSRLKKKLLVKIGKRIQAVVNLLRGN